MNAEISEIDTAAILIALKIKSETAEEIYGAANIMKEKSLKISASDDTIDTLTQAWGEAKIPFKLFKTTRVGYFRQSIFG